MDVMNARRAPHRMDPSAIEALSASQIRFQHEVEFMASIPVGRLAGQPGTWKTSIRSCAADLDHPTILGRRYGVVSDAEYSSFFSELHREVVRRFLIQHPESTLS